MTEKDKERFWSKVAKAGEDECWEWVAARDRAGYGALKVAGKKVNAHRLIYESLHGPIPDGMMICHHCDNPSCVNPKHLFLGTRSDNMLDALKKGRLPQVFTTGRVHKYLEERPWGFRNKLGAEEVREIRRVMASNSNMTDVELAERYGVHRTTIGRIRSRRRWHGLKDGEVKMAA